MRILSRLTRSCSPDNDGLAVVGILQGRSCGGCRIDFSRTQIDKYQHEEGVFRCEYCRRMLVK